MSTPRLRPLTAVLLALSLGACGKLGPLEQPPPLFGAQAKADFAAEQAAKEAAKAAKKDAQRTPTNSNALADQPDPKPTDDAPKTC